jgi:FixJ family two-component response regulator
VGRDHPNARFSPVAGSVLLVDDDPVLLDALPQLFHLRLPTLRFETCGSVVEALGRLGSQDYGAVMTDVRMPKDSGMAVLDRALKLRPCTPVILLTGGRDITLAEKALHDGAFSFLFKPIERDEVVALMQHALSLHELCHCVQAIDARVLALTRRIARLERIGLHASAEGRSERHKRHLSIIQRTVERLRESQAILSRTSEHVFQAKQAQLQRAWERLRQR